MHANGGCDTADPPVARGRLCCVRAPLLCQSAGAARVAPGSYILAADRVLQGLSDVRRGQLPWVLDNSTLATRDVAPTHLQFVIEPLLQWSFNARMGQANIAHWSRAWLRQTVCMAAPTAC